SSGSRNTAQRTCMLPSIRHGYTSKRSVRSTVGQIGSWRLNGNGALFPLRQLECEKFRGVRTTPLARPYSIAISCQPWFPLRVRRRLIALSEVNRPDYKDARSLFISKQLINPSVPVLFRLAVKSPEPPFVRENGIRDSSMTYKSLSLPI